MIKNIRIEEYSFKDYGFNIIFPFKAYDSVIFDNKLIVGFSYGDLQKANPNSEFWRAVWCYNKLGQLLWIVEPPYYLDQETGVKKLPKFIDKEGKCLDAIQSVLYREDENAVIAFGRMGYILDPETGKLGDIVYKER